MEVETFCVVCHKSASNVDLRTRNIYCDIVCLTVETGVFYDVFEDTQTRFSRYEFGGRKLGKGAHGVVISVYNKTRQEHTALKAQVYKNNCVTERIAKEIVLACKLSKIDGFVNLYDYFLCQCYASKEYKRTMYPALYDFDPPLVYMEMEHADGDIAELVRDNNARACIQYEENDYFKFSLVDKLYFFFEIVFSLNVALKAMFFQHGDIAPRNILYVTKRKPRLYELNSGIKVVVNGFFRPLIADFDASSTLECFAVPTHLDLHQLGLIAKSWQFDLFGSYSIVLQDYDGNDYIDVESGYELFTKEPNYDKFLLCLYDRILDLKNMEMLDKLGAS